MSPASRLLLFALVRARFSWWLAASWAWTASHVAASIRGGCWPGYRTPLCSTLMPLTLYIGVTGLALRMQGIEILFQSLLGGFPGVDGAAKNLGPGWDRVTHFVRSP